MHSSSFNIEVQNWNSSRAKLLTFFRFSTGNSIYRSPRLPYYLVESWPNFFNGNTYGHNLYDKKKGAPEFPCQFLTGKKIHLRGKEYFSLSNFFFPVNNFFPCQVSTFFPCQFLINSSKITTINSSSCSLRDKSKSQSCVKKIRRFFGFAHVIFLKYDFLFCLVVEDF